ncbi:alkaline phosphatase family protein [Sphingomonas sp.]|uniref:alkaline phosphatase family protein n=1 Tax=Sphingomonas sp. TaxID=28214 RepID=UPI003B000E2D
MLRRMRRLAILLWVIAASAAPASPVLLISLDGLRPGDVIEARARGMKLPRLAALMREGAYATGVRGVVPTLTYPSHTTLVTGVAPAEHGIANNLTFDPEQKNQQGWYWYASDIKVPTLWSVAHQRGIATANVHWPVSVAAAGVDENLPQIWRTGTDDDRKLLAALATPGLLPPLEAALGPYAQGIDESVAGDATRVRFAAAMLRRFRPGFMTVYLAGIDHVEHQSGPGSVQANAAIERTDALVGVLVDAARAAMPDVTVAVVSDHGFAPVAHDVNLFAPFVRAGLITIGPDGKVAGWRAMPWLAGGTVAVRLADPVNAALRAEVRGVLDAVARDPANGVDRVLDRDAIASLGGPAEASFLVAFRPGFEGGKNPGAPVVSPSTYRGMHGYLPDEPAMRSTLIVAGPSLARKGALGIVDMRSIAPSLGRILGVRSPAWTIPPSF